jgi:hypothetical protein
LFVFSDNMWKEQSPDTMLLQPALFKGTFTVSEKPADTFLNLQVSIYIFMTFLLYLDKRVTK